MTNRPAPTVPSARRAELLEAAYRYALTKGMGDLSLRPLAAAIGSSPRVLLYLFGSKEGLLRELLARARADELALLRQLQQDHAGAEMPDAILQVWQWLSAPAHRDLLTLWLEGYARSLNDPAGPWAGFAQQTVIDWLNVLKAFQPPAIRRTGAGLAQRTAALALLRGALLDLLATGDIVRTTRAIRQQVDALATVPTR